MVNFSIEAAEVMRTMLITDILGTLLFVVILVILVGGILDKVGTNSEMGERIMLVAALGVMLMICWVIADISQVVKLDKAAALGMGACGFGIC